MQVIPGRTKVIVAIEDIKELVANCITMNKYDFDLEISDLPSGKSDLWYPDDSGKWVEVDSECRKMPSELRGLDIHVLTKRERDKKKYYCKGMCDAEDYPWNSPPAKDLQIVAYKVVE